MIKEQVLHQQCGPETPSPAMLQPGIPPAPSFAEAAGNLPYNLGKWRSISLRKWGRNTRPTVPAHALGPRSRVNALTVCGTQQTVSCTSIVNCVSTLAWEWQHRREPSRAWSALTGDSLELPLHHSGFAGRGFNAHSSCTDISNRSTAGAAAPAATATLTPAGTAATTAAPAPANLRNAELPNPEPPQLENISRTLETTMYPGSRSKRDVRKDAEHAASQRDGLQEFRAL